MKQLIKNVFILTAITLVSGLLLGGVYEITKAPIARSKDAAKQSAYKKVLPEATSFESYKKFDEKQAEKVLKNANLQGCRIDEVVVGQSGEEILGYIVTATSTEGYGGEIQVSVGISADGKVNGIEFLAISETAGLGMKAKEPAFYKQFSNKRTETFQVVKNGSASSDKGDSSSDAGATEEHVAVSEIDALSGATITSQAVTSAVNAGLAYYYDVLGGTGNE